VVDRLPSVIVRGYDRRHRMQRARKTRTFVTQKDSDIASAVAREARLSVEAVDSTVIHDYVIQANQTDLEFLQERARRIQYEVFVTDKTLHFRPVQNDRGLCADHLASVGIPSAASMVRQIATSACAAGIRGEENPQHRPG
jgi:phage protein D